MAVQPDITLYDKYDYDYAQYWNNRMYEHEAEVMVLEKILKRKTGAWFIDIGASFGRHVPQYYQKFHHCILLDYSIKSLAKARENMKRNGITNTYLIAANVYNMPLKSNSMNATMTIRLFHHLEDPEKAIGEMIRILKPGGTIIIEFPNKVHLKAIFRELFHFNFSYLFSQEPIEVPTEGHEGSKSLDKSIMYNYHPRYLKKAVVSQETEHLHIYSLSFLRIPFLKMVVPYSILTRIERIFQTIFGWTQLTPSIIISGTKKENTEISESSESSLGSSIESLLVCPSCKGDLRHKGMSFLCVKCNLSFEKNEGVYDLRFPVISE